MNLELLTLLLPKSPDLEVKSISHDALTPQDISHFLANRNLTNEEYTLIMSKFIQDEYAMSELYKTMREITVVLFAERYRYTDEDCTEFLGKMNIKTNEYILNLNFIEKFTKMAVAESIFKSCLVCKGTGKEAGENTIVKCSHCEGTGQFIYNDINRPHMMMIKKSVFKKYKHIYQKILDRVIEIEEKALSKLGN
jgi:hypothetical protein